MRKLIYIFSSILLMQLPVLTFASEVIDVFKDEIIPYNNYVFDLFIENTLFTGKVDATYCHFESTDSRFEKVNQNTKTFTQQYFKNKLNYVEAFNAIQQQIIVLEQKEFSENSYDRNRSINPALSKLEELDLYALSKHGNTIWLQLEASFAICCNTNLADQLTWKKLFVLDINTGRITPWKPVLSKNNITQLKQFISPQINQVYSLTTDKLTASDYQFIQKQRSQIGLDEIKNIETCDDLCAYLNFNDFQFYFFAWGVIARVNDFTMSSLPFYGKGFQFFIPLEQAKAIFKSVSDFQFIQQLTPKESALNNFDEHQILNQIYKYNRPIEPQSYIESLVFKGQIPNKVLLCSTVEYEDGRISPQNPVEYSFNAQGKIISQKRYNNIELDEVLFAETYTYSPQGLLLSIMQEKKQDSDYYLKEYTYDSNNNVAIEKRINTGDCDWAFNLYTGNTIWTVNLEFYTNNISGSELIRRAYKKGLYTNRNNCYALDSLNRVIGTYSKLNGGGINLRRDANHNICELHLSDNKLVYHNYSPDNKLLSSYNYDGIIKGMSTTYSYKEGNILPFECLKDFKSNSTVQSVTRTKFEWFY